MIDEFGIARSWIWIFKTLINFTIEYNCFKSFNFQSNCLFQTKTLDNFCEENNIHKIDFIKIDTGDLRWM